LNPFEPQTAALTGAVRITNQIDALYTDDTTTGEEHSDVSDAVWRVAHSVCSALVCFATLPEVAGLFMVSETQLEVSDGVDSLSSPVITLMQWLSSKYATRLPPLPISELGGKFTPRAPRSLGVISGDGPVLVPVICPSFSVD